MLQDPERAEGDRGTTRTSPEEIAAEYLARRAEGPALRREEFLARLPDAASRKAFEDLVDAAGAAERGLPRAIAAGSKVAGRYRILKKIGEGGMGRVFSAFDEKLGREVALKMLAPLAEGNREREEMFAKEWRLLADLKHPGIVAVHDAGNDGEFTYIVMDLVEGTAISDVIENARRERERGSAGRLLSLAIGREVPPGRRDLVEPHDWYRSCARILLEIAQTLEAAHGRKVIHRDLKPANVMLLGGGAPIVLDFGLAGSPDHARGDVTEGLYGSVAYLAPEQARSQKVGMDPRTDVYQLGLILYEMLTLKRAFPGTAVGDVLDRIEHGDYVLPRKLDPAVPRDLEAICTMALEVSPDRRYATATALREDLERWLEGRAPIASRSARWRTFARTARYTGRKHPVAAAAIGMLLVGTAIYAWRKASEDAPVPPRPIFFHMVPNRGQYDIVDLPDEDAHVRKNDILGFTLVTSGGVEVYALSVYGTDSGERYVSPWSASDANHLQRLRNGDKPWGWHVEGPEERIACTELSTPSQREGLMIFISPKPIPEFEQWRDTLVSMQEHVGVPYSEALDVLGRLLAPTRGPHEKGSWDAKKLEAVRTALLRGSRGQSHRLGLPDVDDFSIECKVDAK